MYKIQKLIGLTVFLILLSIIQSCMVSNKNTESVNKDNNKDKNKGLNDYLNAFRKEYTQEQIDLLLNSTTIFVLRDQDLENKEEFIKAINNVWTLTPIKFLPFDSVKDYKFGNFTFFIIDRIPVFSNGSGGGGYLALNKYSHSTDKKGRQQEDILNFSKIEIKTNLYFPDDSTVARYYKEEGLIKNWTPGMISLYLIRIQKTLKQSLRESSYLEFEELDELKKLKKEKLYVADFVLDKVNTYSGKENKRHNPDKLFKKYPYQIVFIEPDLLSEKILTGEVKFVFEYLTYHSAKFIRVYSVETGRIYQEYQPLSYNLKSKDIARIVKYINK